MPLVVGVRFNPATKVYYFDPTGYEDLGPGEQVVVETTRGEEVGKVIIAPSQVSTDEVVGRLKHVRRRATAVDLVDMAYYRFREEEALARCLEKVEEHGLPMKLIRAEYNYDGRRLVVFFSAERRVDFRRLVQDLARSFKARIELRQIGVRDEAKLMGGIGKCGLPLCCSTWLTEFSPVSIKMAKLQDLPLSPMEISGVCGRLLCCLAYEKDHYAQIRKELPKRGDVLDTEQGRGTVVQIHPIRESVEIELENQVRVEVTQEELNTPASTAAAAPRRERRRRRRPRS
jgi:cell fate regulator YaaT (PSP1 superfamily)